MLLFHLESRREQLGIAPAHRDVGHEPLGGGPCQCHSPGGRVDDVAGRHGHHRSAPGLRPSLPLDDVERLALGVLVPGRPRRGGEADQRHAHGQGPVVPAAESIQTSPVSHSRERLDLLASWAAAPAAEVARA